MSDRPATDSAKTADERTDTSPPGSELSSLSDDELLASLQRLVHASSQITAATIAHLVEVEERRLHLRLGFPSMRQYCRSGLGLSDGQTHRRLTAARLAKRFPVLLDAIREGRIHLCNVTRLRDHFKEGNVEQLVDEVGRKSTRDVQKMLSALSPERSEDRRHPITLRADDALLGKLEHARALMRHQNPKGDLTVIVNRALDLLIDKLERTKLAKTSRPTEKAAGDVPEAPANPAYISRAVRRVVLARDGYQCTFVGDNGVRCSARELLELDHRTPRAIGGSSTAENIRVLCRAHNRFEAERVFGRRHVEKQIDLRRRQEKSREAPAPGPPRTTSGLAESVPL